MYYKVTKGDASILQGNINILDSIGGVPVEQIDSFAFQNCHKLTNIIIPNSIKRIGYDAFSDCVKLTNIEVAEDNPNYKDIDGNLYNKDGTILIQYAIGKTATTFTIPNSVTSIGEDAFFSCDSLTNVVIPDSVTSIGYSAFLNCPKLTSITIPNSVTSIGEEAFSYCPIENATLPTSAISYIPKNKLKTVVINGGSSIGEKTFRSCSSLTSITIPNSVTSIGEDAFEYCESLTIYCEAQSKPSGWDSDWNPSNCPIVWDYLNNDVATDGYTYTIIDGLRYSIKNEVATVVKQSISITTANIPSSITYKGTSYNITSIGNDAFSRCSKLTSIEIPDSVTSIGSNAFTSCSKLTNITIPDSVKSIGPSAFAYCTSLTSITIPDSVKIISFNMFSGCSSLTSIIIPDSVTSIGSNAFYECSSLTSIEIPDSVTWIGSDTFNGCTNLQNITMNAIDPPTIQTNSFPQNLEEIKVPEDSLDVYKNATNWIAYADKISAIGA